MNADDIKLFCVNTNEYIDIDGGESLAEVFDTISNRLKIKPICARVNNKIEDLSYRLYGPKMVEFLDVANPQGQPVYIHSLCMVLYKAIRDLHPGRRLRIEHSIAGGYYCRLKHEKEQVTPDEIAGIKARMKEIIAADMRFVRRERLTTDVVELFRKQGLNDKVRLLESSHALYTTYYKLDDTYDSYYGPLAPSTTYLKTFDLVPYQEGMLLLGPSRDDFDKPNKMVRMDKMFKAFTEQIRFNDVLRLEDVGSLNKAITMKYANMLINVAEAMHNKKFNAIADDITTRYQNGGARVVLIAGPSSSGKTTSSKRLGTQLMTNYIEPRIIELDNYFVNREDNPRDETGDYDYESLYALDLELLNQNLRDLIAGKEVEIPTYNFTTGRREWHGKKLQLCDNNILLLEGIHGLNPDLTPLIDEAQKYRVYVSALTTLHIDDHNWVPTSDNRLLRRIIRDFKYRGATARDTIARWPSVRRGEEKWIFPFQENADATFNSSLIFELSVMRNYAEPILRQVPGNVPEYAEAFRLLRFLSYFEPLDENEVPTTSLLREFLGGSIFHY